VNREMREKISVIRLHFERILIKIGTKSQGEMLPDF
jgi:hypothetical protein